MKKKIAMAVCFLVCLPGILFAHEGDSHEEENKAGLYGTLQAGTIWVNTNDHLFAGPHNKRIASLNDQPDTNAFFPALLFQLNYKTTAGTKYYLGTPADEIAPGLSLGAARTFADKSTFDVSIYSRFMEKVWKDPYVTRSDRDDTTAIRYGACLKYERIYGTNLILRYKYMRQEVGHDVIGDRLKELKRDGDIHKTDVGYEFHFAGGHVILPSFSYEYADMQGGSNSYNGYGMKVQYGKDFGKLEGGLSVQGDKRDFRKTDPIFLDKREDRSLSAIGTITWKGPLGYKQFFISAGLGAQRRHSNIDFYGSRTALGFVTTGYKF